MLERGHWPILFLFQIFVLTKSASRQKVKEVKGGVRIRLSVIRLKDLWGIRESPFGNHRNRWIDDDRFWKLDDLSHVLPSTRQLHTPSSTIIVRLDRSLLRVVFLTFDIPFHSLSSS